MTPSLSGAVVAVTRAGADDDALVEALEAAGARVVRWPTLVFDAPEDPRPLERALASISTYQWIIFTSPRAVEAVAARSAPPNPGAPRIAAVGPATADALDLAGWKVDLVGTEGAEALARVLARSHDVKGARVLFPAGNRARDVLEDLLEEAGAEVDRVEAYRTRLDAPSASRIREDLSRGVDVVAFASPSAVQALDASLSGALSSALEGCGVAAIGPTTGATLSAHGVRGVAVATEPGVPGLVDACASARPQTTGA